jgi:hypothetical protein
VIADYRLRWVWRLLQPPRLSSPRARQIGEQAAADDPIVDHNFLIHPVATGPHLCCGPVAALALIGIRQSLQRQ